MQVHIQRSGPIEVPLPRNAKLERAISLLKTNPPVGSLQEAVRLREAYETLTLEERKKLRKENGNYPYFPVLPQVSPTAASVYETLLNASVVLDVSACWKAIDGGLSTSAVKKCLFKARKQYQARPEVDFSVHLKALLDARLKSPVEQGNPRKRKRGRVRRTQPPVPQRATAPQTQQEEGRPVTYSSISALPEPHRHLVAAGASKYKTTGDKFVLLLIERFGEAELSLTLRPPRVAEPAPSKAKPAPQKAKPVTPKPQTAAASGSPQKMPALHDRLKIVMGNKQVTIQEAIDLLRARDESWVPESKELKSYISLALSTHVKDLFDRVRRGVYRVKGPGGPPKSNGKATNGKATNGKSTNGMSHRLDLDADILDNPFVTTK